MQTLPIKKNQEILIEKDSFSLMLNKERVHVFNFSNHLHNTKELALNNLSLCLTSYVDSVKCKSITSQVKNIIEGNANAK